jgi:hypothetical protein
MSQSSGWYFSITTCPIFTLHFTEHSYIVVAIIKNKMLSISIHMSLPTATPNTPDKISFTPLERIADENQTNLSSPILTAEKNSTFGSLLTARCCFGIASMDEHIYVVGQYACWPFDLPFIELVLFQVDIIAVIVSIP